MAFKNSFERATDFEGARSGRRDLAALRSDREGRIRTTTGPGVNVEGTAKGITRKAQQITASKKQEQEKELSKAETALNIRVSNAGLSAKNELMEKIAFTEGRNAPGDAQKAMKAFEEKLEKITENFSPEDKKRYQPQLDRIKENATHATTMKVGKELDKVFAMETKQNRDLRVSEFILASGVYDKDFKDKMEDAINIMTIEGKKVLGLDGKDLERYKQSGKSAMILRAMDYQIDGDTEAGYKRARELFKDFKRGMTAPDIQKANNLLKAAETYERDGKMFKIYDQVRRTHPDNIVSAEKLVRKLSKGDAKLFNGAMSMTRAAHRDMDSQKRENRNNMLTEGVNIFESAQKEKKLGPETLKVVLDKAKRRGATLEDHNKLRRYYDMLTKGELEKVQSDPNVYTYYDQLFFNDPKKFLNINFASEMVLNPKALSPTHYKTFQARKEWLAKQQFDSPPSPLLKNMYEKVSKVKDTDTALNLINFIHERKKEGKLGDPEQMKTVINMVEQYKGDKGYWLGIGRASPEEMAANQRRVEYSSYHPRFKEIFEGEDEVAKQDLQKIIDAKIKRMKRFNQGNRPGMTWIQNLVDLQYSGKGKPLPIGP